MYILNKQLKEYRSLIKVKVFQNTNNSFCLISKSCTKTFIGSFEEFRLFLKRIKASDSITKPLSQRQVTYTQMINDIISRKDNTIVLWNHIWKKIPDKVKIRESKLIEKDKSSDILQKNKKYFDSIRQIGIRVATNKKEGKELTKTEQKIYQIIINDFIKVYKSMYNKKVSDLEKIDEDATLNDRQAESKKDNIKNMFAKEFIALTKTIYDKLHGLKDKSRDERNKEKDKEAEEKAKEREKINKQKELDKQKKEKEKQDKEKSNDVKNDKTEKKEVKKPPVNKSKAQSESKEVIDEKI